jgi:hypothetical protein
VQISLADQVVCTPIWRPRPDVETLVNTQGDYPPLHALCSGIEATISLGHRAGTGPVEALVDIVAADGTLLPRGSVTLVPDGEKVLLQ